MPCSFLTLFDLVELRHDIVTLLISIVPCGAGVVRWIRTLHVKDFVASRNRLEAYKAQASRDPHAVLVVTADGMDSAKTALPAPVNGRANANYDGMVRQLVHAAVVQYGVGRGCRQF
jgi:hypothetical protein